MNSCKLSVPDKLQVLPPWVVAKHQQNRFNDDHEGGGGDYVYDLILILMLSSSDYWKELFNFQMSSYQNKTFHYLLTITTGCDRIPIESLEWDNPECVFVMVLALAGRR